MARIAVLTGGSTPERHVALAGAAQVVAALERRGCDVSVLDTCGAPLGPGELAAAGVGREPPTAAELAVLAAAERWSGLVDRPELRSADLVFLVLHGRAGEGGLVQALLELEGLPFTGSDALGSAVAMDKHMAKRLLREAGIDTAAWCRWPATAAEVAGLGLPLVVKPSRVGSTVGLTVIDDLADLPSAVESARTWDDEVLLEAFLPGRELSVGVLGDEALAVGEIVSRHRIFDYECKYTPGMADELFPAPIEPDLAAEVRALALRAHRALGLRHFSRIDFRLDAEGRPVCLEANTLPGLTTGSLLPKSAAAAGIEFDELCERICRLGLTPRGG